MKVIEDFTEREVLSEMIGQLRACTINRLVELDDSNLFKKSLDDFQSLLGWESLHVLGGDEVACSIQDKVLRTYKPLLEEYRKGVYEWKYPISGCLMKAIEDFTEREVLSEMIGQLRAYTIRRLIKLDESDPLKHELDDFQVLLGWETIQALGDDEMAWSIQDKVIQSYKSLLREYRQGLYN